MEFNSYIGLDVHKNARRNTPTHRRRRHVRLDVEALKTPMPILSPAGKDKRVRIVGGTYRLAFRWR